MSREEQEAADPVPSPVLDVIGDPSQGRSRLPYLLSQIDEDSAESRLAASCALCLVAEQYEDMREYVIRRLLDRLDDDAPTELLHTLDYLAAAYPHEVDDVLVSLEDEAEVRARRRMYRTGGGFARSDYMAASEPEHNARARVPHQQSDDLRRTYTDEEDDRADDGDSDASESEDEDETESDDLELEDISDGTLTPSRIEELDERLSQVIANSEFRSLDVLAARRRRRYADVYRTLGSVDGEEQAIGLTVFRLPDSDEQGFVDDFRDRLSTWTDVDDHDNVHTVYDWGWHPRPWAAVEFAGIRLTDRDQVDVAEAFWNARELAGTVSYLHQRGIVHGGIDPQNVAYVGNALDEEDREPPLLTNVGLMHAFRWYFDPVEYLDPRYAAPEYFDRRFGRVDHHTDVYQLGMVLYRLFTGRPPYAGELTSIREQVLGRQPRPPSQVVEGLPPALDQLVAKATAKQKMARYETVDHLQQELCSLAAGFRSDAE
jgi:hypothetical protein